MEIESAREEMVALTASRDLGQARDGGEEDGEDRESRQGTKVANFNYPKHDMGVRFAMVECDQTLARATS